MSLWRRAGGLRGIAVALLALAVLRMTQLLVVTVMTDPGEDPLSRLLIWDGGWFINVATEGYPDGYTYSEGGTRLGNGFAFFPLFPLLIRGVAALGVAPTDASLLVAGIAGLAAGLMVYLLGVALWTRRTGFLLMLLVCAQPMSVVLQMGYTEPLFLALAAGTLLAAYQRVWWLAGLLGPAAALTRPTGMAVGIALAVAVVMLWRRSRLDNGGLPAWAAPTPLAGIAGTPAAGIAASGSAAFGTRTQRPSAVIPVPGLPSWAASSTGVLPALSHGRGASPREEPAAPLGAAGPVSQSRTATPREEQAVPLAAKPASQIRGSTVTASVSGASDPDGDDDEAETGKAGNGIPLPFGEGGLLSVAAARTGSGASARRMLVTDPGPFVGKGRASRDELIAAGIAALATLLAGPLYLAWVGWQVGEWDAWFKVQTAGWGSTFDFGGSIIEFIMATLRTSGSMVEVATVWLILGVLLMTGLAMFDKVWPPMLVFGLVMLVMALGQAGYWHSKPRLLVPALLLASVPIAKGLAKMPLRTALAIVALWAAFGIWFGSYMINIWPFTI